MSLSSVSSQSQSLLQTARRSSTSPSALCPPTTLVLKIWTYSFNIMCCAESFWYHQVLDFGTLYRIQMNEFRNRLWVPATPIKIHQMDEVYMRKQKAMWSGINLSFILLSPITSPWSSLLFLWCEIRQLEEIQDYVKGFLGILLPGRDQRKFLSLELGNWVITDYIVHGSAHWKPSIL